MSKFFEESIMTVVMLAIFTTMVAISFNYPPASRFMVLVVGLPGIGLCLLQLGLDLRKHLVATASPRPAAQTAQGVTAPAGPSPAAGESFGPGMARKEIILWAYVLGLIAGILLFGFNITVPIFLFTFLAQYARVGFLRALIYTVLACVMLYVIFDYVFRMPLHTGFVTDYVMDRISG